MFALDFIYSLFSFITVLKRSKTPQEGIRSLTLFRRLACLQDRATRMDVISVEACVQAGEFSSELFSAPTSLW